MTKRLEVTDKELNDTKKVWDGETLFELTNAQLAHISEARTLAYDSTTTKREYVKLILDGQMAAKKAATAKGPALTEAQAKAMTPEVKKQIEKQSADVPAGGSGRLGGSTVVEAERLADDASVTNGLVELGKQGVPSGDISASAQAERAQAKAEVLENDHSGKEIVAAGVVGEGIAVGVNIDADGTPREVTDHANAIVGHNPNAAVLHDGQRPAPKNAEGLLASHDSMLGNGPQDGPMREAFARSGLTPEGWNVLSDEEREAAVQVVLTERKSLYGSSVQPSTFNLANGQTLQLGDVVREAYERTGLDIEGWNALDDTTREEYLQLVVDELELVGDEVAKENELAAASGEPTRSQKFGAGPALRSSEHDRPADDVLSHDGRIEVTEKSQGTLHGHYEDLKSVV